MNRDRNTLKRFFTKGAIPSQENFADLIESAINQVDDGIAKLPNDSLQINATGPGENVLNFYRKGDSKPAWALSLNSGGDSPKAGLNISSTASGTAGGSRLFIDYNSGNVGIGNREPRTSLDVNGQIVAVNRLTLAQDTGDTTQTWHVDNDKGQFRLFWQPDIKPGTIGTGALVATTGGKVAIGGKVGIGTWDLQAIEDGLDVDGSVRILTGSNPILFTSALIGFANAGTNDKDAKKNRAEISNDTGTFKELMIVGNTSAGIANPLYDAGLQKRVGVWDRLDVHGELRVYRNQDVHHDLVVQHGKVGIGTDPKNIEDGLDVNGSVRILTGSNPIRFTSAVSSFTNARTRAEIANDTIEARALVILGNSSAGALIPYTDGPQRRVKMFDRLDVYGEFVQHAPMIESAKPGIKWEDNKDHPLQQYFRDKLDGQPPGTMLCVMSAQWDDAPHYWIGCVTGDKIKQRKWLTYLKPGAVELL
jgi:hypothetical protein